MMKSTYTKQTSLKVFHVGSVFKYFPLIRRDPRSRFRFRVDDSLLGTKQFADAGGGDNAKCPTAVRPIHHINQKSMPLIRQHITTDIFLFTICLIGDRRII